MATYRQIYMRIWKDPDFQELDASEKLLFIYLCTNEAVTESGIYPMSPRTAAHETGLAVDVVTDRLTSNFYKNILYDKDNKTIFVKKLRHNQATGGRPELLDKAVFKNYQLHPSDLLWEAFFREYPAFITVMERLSNGWRTVTKPLYIDRINTTSSISTSIATSNSISISKEGLPNGCATVGKQLDVSDNGKDKAKTAIDEVRVIGE